MILLPAPKWRYIWMMVAAFTAIGCDIRNVPGPPIYWRVAFLTVAAVLLLWRYSLIPWVLTLGCGILFVATFTRMMVFLLNERYAGMGYNLLVTMGTFRFLSVYGNHTKQVDVK